MQQRTSVGGLALLSARVVVPLLAVVALLLYLPGIFGWAVTDDIHQLKGALVERWPLRTFFRPLERGVNVLNVRWFGLENLSFAHAFGLAGFVSVAVLTYALGRRLARGPLSAALAAGLVAVSPLAVASVVQIDTLSQQFVTVFVLLFLHTLLAAKARASGPLYGLAYAFALLALLSKESAPGLVAAVPLAAFLLRPPARAGRRTLRGLFGDLLSVALVAALYVALRTTFGVGFGGDVEDGQYALELTPARLLHNLGLYGGSLLYTGGSTLDLFPVLRPGRVALGGLLTAALLVPSLVGAARLVRSGTLRWPLLGLALLTLAGTFPVVLTEQVSELYTYGSLPFYALLLGLTFPAGVTLLAERLRARWLRPAAAGFVALLLVWSAWGVAEKVRLVDDLGARSLGYFEQTQAFLERAPGPLRLCWRDAPGRGTPAYSTFVMRPELVAGRAMGFAAWLEGRPLYLAAPDGPFDNVGVAAGDWLPPPVPLAALPPATLAHGAGCTHSVTLGGDGLRFAQR